MSNDVNNIDSLLDLWDNIGRLTFFLPLKQAKDRSYRILVTEDPDHEGMHMLRVFLCKEDLELFSKIYSKDTYHTTAPLSSIEEYMSRNHNVQQNLKLSRCVLCAIDIKKIIREVETLWKFNNY